MLIFPHQYKEGGKEKGNVISIPFWESLLPPLWVVYVIESLHWVIGRLTGELRRSERFQRLNNMDEFVVFSKRFKSGNMISMQRVVKSCE